MSFRYTGQGVKEISFESLAQPLMHVQERHDKLEDNINLMNSQAAQLDYIIKKEEEINPDSPIVNQYKGYLDNIKNVADTLSTKGVLDNANVRNQVSKLNTAFNRDILPISIGNERRERQIALENELRIKNPNLLFTRRANTTGLSDFMNNTYKTDVLDLNTVMAEGANIGNILSSLTRGEKVNKSMPGYLKVTKILGFDPVDALVKGNVDLDNLIDMYYQKQSSTYNPEIMNTNGEVVKNAFVKGVYGTLKSNDQSQYMSDKQWDVSQQRANIDYQFKKQAKLEAEKQAAAQATLQAAALSKFTPYKNYVSSSDTKETLSTERANTLANQYRTYLNNKSVNKKQYLNDKNTGIIPQNIVIDQVGNKSTNRVVSKNYDTAPNPTLIKKEVAKVYPQTEKMTDEEFLNFLDNTAYRNEMYAQNAYVLNNSEDINKIVEKIIPNLDEGDKKYSQVANRIFANPEGGIKYTGEAIPRITYFMGKVTLDFYKDNKKVASADVSELLNNIFVQDNSVKYFTDNSAQLDNIFKTHLTNEDKIKLMENITHERVAALTFLSSLTE